MAVELEVPIFALGWVKKLKNLKKKITEGGLGLGEGGVKEGGSLSLSLVSFSVLSIFLVI